MPFGSVGGPIIAIWAAVLGLGAVLASPQTLSSNQARLLAALWAFCGCWIVVLVLQVLPSMSLDNPIWADAADVLGIRLQAIPAALRCQPLLAQGPPLLAVLALSCAIVLGSDDKFADAILVAFAWSGLAYAIFGIISYGIDPSKILGFDKSAYLAELTATFYNRNTAAIYFGSCAVVWMTRAAEKIRKARSHRSGLADRGRFLSAEFLVPGFALAICLVAMFMTRSRAGSVASIVGLIVTLLAISHRSFVSRSSLLVAGAGTVFGAALLIQFLGGGVAERISVEGVSDAGRWQVYRSTLQMIQSAPWLGTGLGTYPWTFPAYRSSSISTWGVWDRAHNTFLELMAEVGIPISVLLALGWVMMFAVLVRGVSVRRRGVGRPAVALGILVAATLHSMVDFHLQIPAFSITVFAVVGVGLAQSFRRPNVSLRGGKTSLNPIHV
jgi:hypothetical protein